MDGGNGHYWKKPCRLQGCGPSNNAFRGSRQPLRHKLPTGPYMNYAKGNKYAGIQQINEVVGSRRGAGGRVTRRIL